VENERLDHAPRRAEFFYHHTERDEGESAQALDGQEKAEEFSAEVIRKKLRHRHSHDEAHLRRIERAGVSLLHRSNVVFRSGEVKEDFACASTGDVARDIPHFEIAGTHGCT
jgi:hypothetical protein